MALIPTIALAGVWTATTSQLLSQGFDLRSQADISTAIGQPANAMLYDLQRERVLTAIWLADSASTHGALDSQRPKTDASLTAVSSMAQGLDGSAEHARATLQPLVNKLQNLPLQDLRAQIDRRSIGSAALESFTQILNAAIFALRQVTQVDDGFLVTASASLGTMVSMAEQIQLEDTALAPAVATGRLTTQARAQFAQAVGAQRFLLAMLPSQLPPEDRAELQQLTSSAAWASVISSQDAVLEQSPPASRSGEAAETTALPEPARYWRAALDQVGSQMKQLIARRGTALLGLQATRANDLIRHGATISAAGFAAVIIVALLSWRITGSLLRRMAGLRKATLEVAEVRLPTLVDRLNRNETVDIESEAPKLDYGHDELGQVAKAFDSAQRTAVRSAVALADARRGFERAILGVARHTQSLVNRQLSLLDRLERAHQEPEVLEALYQLDSQASQMRRYDENLVIIAGGRPGRSWSEPIAVVDVLRSAVGEVADYQRISVHADDQLRLAAHAVADVIHVLAELLDNATAFSPPACPVWVRANQVSRGLAIEIEDRGIGMSAEEYTDASRRLRQPPQFDVLALADDVRLGIFVVGRLAARHNIRITLRPSPYGGTSAILLIPPELVVHEPTPNGHVRIGEFSSIDARFMAPAPVGSGARSTDLPDFASPTPVTTCTPLGSPSSRTLPLRVPQASLVEELRNVPVSRSTPDHRQEPVPPAERVAATMSAFQRGTQYAREFGSGSPTPAKGPQ
ncbi:nitrate- and nitrite sensing domain-containing protein [Streptomyces sp. NPDC002730]|uniref:sensor histidine kinase n=1 Tax=Streptomyces sp. NPDC002730 TaxID=3364662 RepID=UPI00368042FD